MVIDIDQEIKNALMRHLNIDSHWYGNYGTSQFGVILELKWDGYPIASCCVNFLEDDKDK